LLSGTLERAATCCSREISYRTLNVLGFFTKSKLCDIKMFKLQTCHFGAEG